MKIYLKMMLAALVVAAQCKSFAETCPTIDELRHQKFNHWSAYDIDNGTPLSQDRIDDYTANIKQFALATYYEDAPEGAAMCYYKDADDDDTYHNAYLAKPGLKPDLTQGRWHKNNDTDYECPGDLNACAFIVS